MSYKYICDDCKQEALNNQIIRLWAHYDHPLDHLEFCYSCFAKHWKPISKRFSLKKKLIDKRKH